MGRRDTAGLLIGCCASLLIAGCAHHVYTPPVRTNFLESPRALAPDQTGIQGSYGAHGQVFGFDADSGGLRLRRGLTHEVETTADLSLVRISGDSAAQTDPFIYTLRLGAKYAPEVTGGHFAAVGGLGGGHSAAGFHTGADIGLIGAFENPYLVPFVLVFSYLSIPIDPDPVDTTEVGDPVGTHVDTPEITGGFGASFGLRVPAVEHLSGTFGGSLYTSFTTLSFMDSDEGDSSFSWEVGIEFDF